MGMRSTVIALLAASLVLAACGSPAESGGPGAGASSPGPDTPTSSTPDPGEPVPSPSPSRVEPRPGQTDVREIGWDTYTRLGPRRLEVTFSSGIEPCYVLDHVDVSETESKITITLFEGRTPTEEDIACIEIAVLKSVVVELDSPLGDRKVKDGTDH